MKAWIKWPILLCAILVVGTSCTEFFLGNGQQESENLSLASILIVTDDGTNVPLSPTFSSQGNFYNISLGAEAQTITITAVAEDEDAEITIADQTGTGEVTADVQLNGGFMEVFIRVSKGNRSLHTTISIQQDVPSIVDTLNSLTTSIGTLSPSFSPNTIAYSLRVPDGTSSLNLTATLSDTNATFTINGTAGTSGQAHAVTVSDGSTISIIVTAQAAGNQRTYTIDVLYAPEVALSGLTFDTGTLDPVFDPGVTSYILTVDPSITQVYLTASNDGDGNLQVNGSYKPYDTSVGPIDINDSTQNPIEVKVVLSDQFGTTEKTYTVEVTYPPADDADLAGLSVSPGSLSPSFSSDTTTYSVALNLSGVDAVSSIGITPTLSDPNATVTVAGSASTSGVAESVSTLVSPIDIEVTAEDGTTIRTYSITLIDNGPGGWSYIGLLGTALTGENLKDPSKVAVDSTGNIYVVDSTQRGVHKFDSNGTFDSLITYTGMDAPVAIGIDRNDNSLYVADEYHDKVFKFDSSGNYILEFGEYGNGDGQFYGPELLTVDPSGSIYVFDGSNDYVQQFNSLGQYTEKIGAGILDAGDVVDIAATNEVLLIGIEVFGAADKVSSFNTMTGALNGDVVTLSDYWYLQSLAVDDTGDIFIMTADETIETYAPDGTAGAVYGGSGSGSGQFANAGGIAVASDGSIIVADTGNGIVQKLDASGNFIVSFGQLSDGQIGAVRDFAVDGNSNVYVLDTGRGLVQVFDNTQTYLRSWTVNTTNTMSQIAVDQTNELVYVGIDADNSSRLIQHDLFGSELVTIDGGSSTFNGVDALTVDPDTGYVYVGDGNDISYYDQFGTYQNTFDNNGTVFGDTDEMMFDSWGSLLVGSSDSDEILVFDADGTFDSVLYSQQYFEGAFWIDDDDYLYIPDKDFSGYDLIYYDPITDEEIWTLSLETLDTTITSGPATIQIAPDGTVYIEARHSANGILVYTR